METETRMGVKLKNGKEVWIKAQPIPYFHREGFMSRAFGLVSKKKLVREMVDIYVENDTDSGIATGTNMVYYCMGNSNALNALSSRLGIDLRPYIRDLRSKTKRTEPPEEERHEASDD